MSEAVETSVCGHNHFGEDQGCFLHHGVDLVHLLVAYSVGCQNQIS